MAGFLTQTSFDETEAFVAGGNLGLQRANANPQTHVFMKFELIQIVGKRRMAPPHVPGHGSQQVVKRAQMLAQLR
jgi:hypothetical protein